MTTSDHELLEAYAQRGDEAAFTELVRRHAGAVEAAARRQTQSPELAEEVMQAVFVKLAQKAGNLSSGTILIGWLMKATRYAAINALRHEIRRQRHHAELKNMEIETPSPSADSAVEGDLWGQVEPVLDQALNRLRAADRSALLLRFFSRKSLAEVGASLGIAEEAARKRVARALERLKVELQSEGVTTGALALSEWMVRHAAPEATPALVQSALNPTARAQQLARPVGLSGHAIATVWGLGIVVLAGLGIAGGWWGIHSGWGVRSATRPAWDSSYSVAGFPEASVVHEFLGNLQQAVRSGDRQTVAQAMRYPLAVHLRGATQMVPDSAAFLGQFDQIFRPGVAAAILQAPERGLYCDARGVMVGAGYIWLGPSEDPLHPKPQIIALNPP